MALSKCSRNFHRMKIYERATLAAGVNDLYYKAGSPFTAPVISQTDFETLRNSLSSNSVLLQTCARQTARANRCIL